MATAHVKPGDEVDVPWGLDTFHGVVVEVYQSRGPMRARVRLDATGDEDPQVITVPVDDIVASEPTETEFTRHGGWLRYAEYEHQLQEALSRAMVNLHFDATLRSAVDVADRGLDFIIESPDFILVVEVKWQVREFQKLLRQLKLAIDTVSSEHGRSTAGLLVAPNAPRAIVSTRQLGPFQPEDRIVFTRWRGHEDDDRLQEAIGTLIAATRTCEANEGGDD
jgi:hypothetical protein